MAARFVEDTAVTPQGDGRYTADVDPAWRVQRPNGGYLAAILLRAVTTELGDASRPPRSLAIHYLRPPEHGPAEVDVTVERSGRRMTSLSARMRQDDRTLAVALVAAGQPQPGTFAHDDAPMPDVPPPDELAPSPPPPFPVPIRENFELRPALGPASFSGGDEALTGGWIRLKDPGPIDAEYLAQIADAWVPAAFGVMDGRAGGLPTVDLTVHFRQAAVSEDPWLLVRFRTRLAAEGYLEEDGEIWDRDGRLLAHSRQLAVIL
jgi:acyl-CoA thioesterase